MKLKLPSNVYGFGLMTGFCYMIAAIALIAAVGTIPLVLELLRKRGGE